MIRLGALIIMIGWSCGPALAGSQTLDAAIGGAIGGAAGAAVGSEVGGRTGAVMGSAIGAAAGTAITTDRDDPHTVRVREVEHVREIDHVDVVEQHRGSGFCPPGLAKKGRC